MKPFKVRKCIVYARVSTKQQDLEMQIEYGKAKAEELGFTEDQVIIIKDDGVSARNKALNNRTGLVEVLHKVETGVYDYLIVYDRDRIARNMNEYIEIIKKIKDKIYVVFSNDTVPPFNKDNLGYEASNALAAESEGNKINANVKNWHKKNPYAPYGYERNIINHLARYEQIPNRINKVKALFEEFNKIESKEQYEIFLVRWKGVLSKSRGEIQKLLCNAFYAATFIEPDGKVIKIKAIEEPISTVEVIKANRKKFEEWDPKKGVIKPILVENSNVPISCSICGQLLKQKFSKGSYVYSCGHAKKVKGNRSLIKADQLEDYLKMFLVNLIENCKNSYVKKITIRQINSLIRTKEDEIKKLMKRKEKITMEITRNTNNVQIVKEKLKGEEDILETISIMKSEIQALELLKNDLNLFVKRVQKSIKEYVNDYFINAMNLLVDSVEIGHGYIVVNHIFAEFLKEEA